MKMGSKWMFGHLFLGEAPNQTQILESILCLFIPALEFECACLIIVWKVLTESHPASYTFQWELWMQQCNWWQQTL